MSRRVLAALLFLCATAAAPEVRANYTESKITTEDVRAVVQRDGSMVVTHALGVRVLAGALRSFALTGLEDDLRLRPTAALVTADGKSSTASVVRDAADVVHVTVDDPKGIKRGDYRFEIVYEASLASRVTRDGAFDRVRFALPPLRDGVDGARLVLDLPSAPTEPRADAAPDEPADLATLRRSADRDELELVRPHVPKGEAATFYARVDPKALSALPGAVPGEVVSAPPPAPPPRTSLALEIVVAATALLAFALGLAKGRLLASSSREARPVGLVPLPPAARALLAAAALGAGVFFEARGRMLVGAVFVAASLPLLAWRFATSVPRVRGRATWLVVKPREAFAPARSSADWLDATTARGGAALAGVALACGIACWLARAAGPCVPYWIAIDALALVPLFFTGSSRQLPPSATREGAALAPVARALANASAVKIAPLARVSGEGFDELRLLASPRLAMAGTSAIEIGVAWQRAGGASSPSFDVLVRVQEGTFASAKMAAAFPDLRALPGRKPEERVFRFEPQGPRPSDAASLALDLAETLRDRRLAIAAPVPTTDRRVRPNARRPQEAAA